MIKIYAVEKSMLQRQEDLS